MFFGFVPLGTTTFGFPIQCTNGSRTPSAPTGTPTWRIYGPNGSSALLTGTSDASDTDSQTGLRWVTPVAITQANGFVAGSTYTIRADYTVSAVEEVDLGTFICV